MHRSKHRRYSITSSAATSSGLRHGEAEYLSGLRVDDEFELSRLHDWQLRRFGAPHSPPMTMMPSSRRINGPPHYSALQLALELVPVAPIRTVGENLVRTRLDHARLAQPQRVKTARILGIVVPPTYVRISLSVCNA